MAEDSRVRFFSGKVQDQEYSQPVQIEGGRTSARTLYTAHTKEQKFVFTGMSESQAHDTSQITVTDVGGTSYTITPASSFTDGSSGYAVFEKEIVSVARERISPHLWRMTVIRRGAELYANGTKIISAPAWTGW